MSGLGAGVRSRRLGIRSGEGERVPSRFVCAVIVVVVARLRYVLGVRGLGGGDGGQVVRVHRVDKFVRADVADVGAVDRAERDDLGIAQLGVKFRTFAEVEGPKKRGNSFA